MADPNKSFQRSPIHNTYYNLNDVLSQYESIIEKLDWLAGETRGLGDFSEAKFLTVKKNTRLMGATFTRSSQAKNYTITYDLTWAAMQEQLGLKWQMIEQLCFIKSIKTFSNLRS